MALQEEMYARIRQLVLKKIAGTLTDDEEKELNSLLGQSEINRESVSPLMDRKSILEEISDMESARKRTWDKLHSQLSPGTSFPKPEKTIVMPIRRLIPWAVAASLLLVISVWFFRMNNTTEPKKKQLAAKINDIPAPRSSHATVTLADGHKVDLDSLIQGMALTQQGISLTKLADGSLAYEGKATGLQFDAPLVFNRIDNPKGSKVVSFRLADGSHVWLNAGSSMRFPILFPRNERKVIITGEAYFDVAKNPARPFKVEIPGNFTVEVTGTQFNVFAYPDEETTSATLVEGKVTIHEMVGNVRTTGMVLNPGEQAVVQNGQSISRVRDADVHQVTAWKNGKFDFGESTDFQMAMREISRWYDLDIQYRDKVDQRIGGSMSRNVSLSNVLDMLEVAGAVDFQIDGKKVIVKNKR